jgi:hypothetical protein
VLPPADRVEALYFDLSELPLETALEWVREFRSSWREPDTPCFVLFGEGLAPTELNKIGDAGAIYFPLDRRHKELISVAANRETGLGGLLRECLPRGGPLPPGSGGGPAAADPDGWRPFSKGPVDHWEAARYPLFDVPERPIPLRWRADFASRLAVDWYRRLLRSVRGSEGLLQFPGRTCIEGFPEFDAASDTWQIKLTDRVEDHVAAIVLATGFGVEGCSVDGPYRGPSFWDPDSIGAPGWGVAGRRAPRIVISGGGYGGLQDFLRAMTGLRAARAILGRIPIDREHLLAIASAEDRAVRASIWGTGLAHDHSVFQRLHDVHAEVVAELLRSIEVRRSLDELLAQRSANVLLTHRCTHFTQCYALNRFLVLLIATFLERHANRPRRPIRPGSAVVRVLGSGHRCSTVNPSACFGQPHQVWVQEWNCEMGVSGDPVLLDEEKDIVVVRHGPTASPDDQTRWEAGLRPLAQTRQILPYHVTD